ncbi:MAG TPA: hypothetical protein PKC28_02945 [Bdellovibrionales bacterium]|nr:hypothetical protein [Bdellovibrionales bacterium]
MRVFVLLNVTFSLFSVASFADQSPELKRSLEQINERYDDFLQVHDAQERRQERIDAQRGNRRAEEKARAHALEKARVEFIQSKKKRESDEPLRVRWEKEQKGRQEEFEMLRARYVDRRDTVEQYLRKGREIPPMKEFDLEDY